MQVLIVIFIILMVISNSKSKSKKAQNKKQGAQPAQAARQRAAQNNAAKPFKAAADAAAMAQPRKPFTPPPATETPERIAMAMPTADDDEGTSKNSAFERGAYTGSIARAATDCDDGYGSIPHSEHEGEEFHAPGTHGKPGMLAGAARGDEGEDDGETVPGFMGLKLNASAMQQAVVMSEILTRRGGRGTWSRI